MEELPLIALYLARDERAIQATDSKYGKLCFRVANNLLRSREDAEECVNDTYLSLWNSIPPAKPENFTAFICKITRNLALKKLERANAHKRKPAALVPLDELAEVLPAPDIGEEALGALISDFLWHQNETVRAVFLRRYWFFDSIDDIAKRYSFSRSKVKSMLFHTRNRLREALQKEGVAL